MNKKKLHEAPPPPRSDISTRGRESLRRVAALTLCARARWVIIHVAAVQVRGERGGRGERGRSREGSECRR
eukprot:763395-Hanusia_phi.AAC.13